MLTFLFTALYFFIIELLDRTLRDRMRSERITKIPVMGCFPKESSLRYRRYNKTINDMALRQLSKALLPHFKEGQQNVLNLLSTDAANGKSYLAQELQNYWVSIGLPVRLLTYDEDYETNAFPLDGMRKVAKRICLAGGINKAESILAAAHAGYYTVLLTDSLTARRLYELVRSEIMR
jgi:hypothetical protein